MTTLHTRSLVALALCAGLCATALAQPPAAAKDQPAKKDPAAPPKDAPKDVSPKKEPPAKKDEPLQVKAFELKVASPPQVQQALSKLAAAPVAIKGGPPAPPTFRVAFDIRTKSVFVRGTADDIAAAGKLIAQLDSGTLYHLQNASVPEVMGVLTALDIGGKVQVDPQTRTIAVLETDPNAENIKAVITRLDAVKTETPGLPPRK
jgi:hypothetical protein